MAKRFHRKLILFICIFLLPSLSFSDADVSMGSLTCPPNPEKEYDSCLVDQWANRVIEAIRNEKQKEAQAMSIKQDVEAVNRQVDAIHRRKTHGRKMRAPAQQRAKVPDDVEQVVQRVEQGYRKINGEQNKCFGQDAINRFNGVLEQCYEDVPEMLNTCKIANKVADTANDRTRNGMNDIYRRRTKMGAFEMGEKLKELLKTQITTMRTTSNTCLSHLKAVTSGVCREVYSELDNADLIKLYSTNCTESNISEQQGHINNTMGSVAIQFGTASSNYEQAMDKKIKVALRLEKLAEYLVNVKKELRGEEVTVRQPASTGNK